MPADPSRWTPAQRRAMERLANDVRRGRLIRREPSRHEAPHWTSSLVCDVLGLLASGSDYHFMNNVHYGTQPAQAAHRDLWLDAAPNLLWIYESQYLNSALMREGEWRKLGAGEWFDIYQEQDLQEIRGDDQVVMALSSNRISMRCSPEWPTRYMNDHLRQYNPRRASLGPPEAYGFERGIVTDDEVRRLQERSFARHGETAAFIILRTVTANGFKTEILSGPYPDLRHATIDLDSLHQHRFEDSQTQLRMRTMLPHEQHSHCSECLQFSGFSHQRHCSHYQP